MKKNIQIAVAVLLAFPMLALSSRPSLAYNGSDAAVYADIYWQQYNSNYPDFSSKSDDCTNYISQALNYGGDAMTANTGSVTDDRYWFMEKPCGTWVWTNSWSVAGDQWLFLYNSGREYQINSVSGAYYNPNHTGAYAGDVIYYAWHYYDNPPDHSIHHAAIQVQDDYDENFNFTSVVDTHTSNHYHANWTLYVYNMYAATTQIYITRHR